MDPIGLITDAMALWQVARDLWKTALLSCVVGLLWGLVIYPRIRIPGGR